jgi:neutral ceramidase
VSGLRAGFGRVEITPARGARLVGYAQRTTPAAGQHDPLFARALVLEEGHERVAIASLELCYVGEDVVAEVREAVAHATGIRPDRVLVAASHTHSGPHDADCGAWADGLPGLAAAAIRQASERLEPARVGAGWGMLHGRSLNRRRLEDPVDPAVGVARVDGLSGRTLGLLFTFGCHPVVLGPDNLLGSGDWPGHAAQSLELRLGRGAVVLFAQGGSGDVNPLAPDLGHRIERGATITATTPDGSYYGSSRNRTSRIGDRTGGSFEHVAALGGAVADEVERVQAGIRPRHRESKLLVRRLLFEVGGSKSVPSDPPHALERPRSGPETPLEVMLIWAVDAGLLLVAQPGEVFAESTVRMRHELRRRGVPFPLAIGYANGWRGYLPPPSAYLDGGYEVEWARASGIGEPLQDEILAATLAATLEAG